MHTANRTILVAAAVGNVNTSYFSKGQCGRQDMYKFASTFVCLKGFPPHERIDRPIC